MFDGNLREPSIDKRSIRDSKTVVDFLRSPKIVATVSGSLLPVGRIAAGMKTGDDKQASVLNDEKQRVGEATQKGAAHVFVDHGELQRAGAHALGQGVNRCAETAPSPALRLRTSPARRSIPSERSK